MERMLFATVGWMNRYQGISPGDSIRGGGSFVDQEGYGHEIFNFLPFRGRMYGYVQTPGDSGKIGVERLGAAPDADRVASVTVVWISRHPRGGVYVVGWYKDATVHREWQDSPGDRRRRHNGGSIGFNISARESDCLRLDPDERTFKVPNGPEYAHRNVWYADRPEHREFRQDVIKYMASRVLPDGPTPASSAPGHQPDPFLRVAIERQAIELVMARYTELGYTVSSVERDNVGWDLEAVSGGRKLLLEVKGLSADSINVEVTPNEYVQLQRYRADYRMCIVTSATTAPALRVFAYSPDSGAWEDNDGQRLRIQEVTRTSAWLSA